MSTFRYVAGEWYVIITCGRCKSRQPIFHDLTEGKANINAIYTWQCSECGHKGHARLDQGRTPKTLNGELSVLRQLLKYAGLCWIDSG